MSQWRGGLNLHHCYNANSKAHGTSQSHTKPEKEREQFGGILGNNLIRKRKSIVEAATKYIHKL
jgi:hypothetical protein